MKQRYEERIAELEDERNAAEQEQERVELELNRAVDAGRRLQAQLSHAGAPDAAPHSLHTEVHHPPVLLAVSLSVSIIECKRVLVPA